MLIPLKNIEAKEFYAQKAIVEILGVRDLRKQIATKALERTHIANLQIANSEILTLNTFKDPYLLNFLGVQNTYLKKIWSRPFCGNWKRLF